MGVEGEALEDFVDGAVATAGEDGVEAGVGGFSGLQAGSAGGFVDWVETSTPQLRRAWAVSSMARRRSVRRRPDAGLNSRRARRMGVSWRRSGPIR